MGLNRAVRGLPQRPQNWPRRHPRGARHGGTHRRPHAAPPGPNLGHSRVKLAAAPVAARCGTRRGTALGARRLFSHPNTIAAIGSASSRRVRRVH